MLLYNKWYSEWSFHSDFPVVISTNTTTFEELEERRLIFKQPEDTWYDVDVILPNEVPEGFDMDVLSKFLSLCHVTINGEPYTYKIRKPTKMGRKMYISKSIKRAWFCRTDDGFLLFRSNMAASMTADKRWVVNLHHNNELMEREFFFSHFSEIVDF